MLVRLLYASRAASPLTDSVIDVILAQSRAERYDDGLELVVAVNLIGADLFDVEHNDLVTRWEGLRQPQSAALVRMPNP